jgi:hypothetical protein
VSELSQAGVVATCGRGALKAEADEYVASFVDEIDERGARLVVRNGRPRAQRHYRVGHRGDPGPG